MDRPRLAAVAFDFDGLMFNTEELYCDVAAEMLRRRGKPCPREMLDAMMGRPAAVAYHTMIEWHGLNDRPDDLAEEAGEIFLGILDGRVAPMPGLLDLLDALESAAIPKAIATSSRRKFVTGILGRFGFEPRFTAILSAEDVTRGKPHPEVYWKAAQQFGVPPEELLVLEDSQNGCAAAVASGAFAVAVPGEHSRNHDFRGARLVLDTLADRRLYAALGL